MTSETVSPKRLVGACREVTFFITEHEIAELEAFIEKHEGTYMRRRGKPTKEELWLMGALHRGPAGVRRGQAIPGADR